MNTRIHTSLLAAATISGLSQSLPAQQGSARYELTLQSAWSAATHPTQFPSNPHYSPLVGGLHDSSAEFWSPGQIASAGIEQMAETGGTSLLASEVMQQILAGNANQVLNFGGAGALGNSPGQLTVSFTAQPGFSQLSLVAMLAPSPDWFVGVHGFNLMENDDWIENAVIPLHVYDAGTDNGTTYTSGNANTSPRVPISVVSTASGPFQGASTMVATFTIQRVSSTLVYGCSQPTGSLSISGTAELGQTLQFALMDPTGLMPTPAVAGLALAATRDIHFPCGTSLPGFGLAPGMAGEVLLGSLDALAIGPTFTGGAAIMLVTLPNQVALLGQEFYCQGLFVSTRVGLTRAVAIRIGN